VVAELLPSGAANRRGWARRWRPAATEVYLADRYTMERELGRGGMAVVDLAQDLRTSPGPPAVDCWP